MEQEYKVFVYGTLKRGYGNHYFYCKDATHVEKGHIIGRIYDLIHGGFPGIQVPDRSIMVEGTKDHGFDAKLQETLTDPEFNTFNDYGDEWGKVFGEVITFKNPLSSFNDLDRLEGFRPGVQGCLYERALVLAESDGNIFPVWAYHMNNQNNMESHGARRIESGTWRRN